MRREKKGSLLFDKIDLQKKKGNKALNRVFAKETTEGKGRVVTTTRRIEVGSHQKSSRRSGQGRKKEGGGRFLQVWRGKKKTSFSTS